MMGEELGEEGASSGSREWWFTLLNMGPLLLSVRLVALLVPIWAARFVYPYDLEWMEGGMLVHALRIRQGLPLYPEPGPDFIPYIYPPGYATLLAFFSQLSSLDYGVGRALSLSGVGLACAVLLWLGWRHGRSLLMGVFGASVFLACYGRVGAFYDLVRLDGVFVGLFALYLALSLERSRSALRGAALVLATAFWVKQQAALFGIPVGLAIWARDGWRRAAEFAVWSALPALALTGWWQWRSGGTYLTYLVSVPSSHGIVGSRILPGTVAETGATLGVALALIAIALVREIALKRGKTGLLGPLIGGLIALGVEAALPIDKGSRWVLPIYSHLAFLSLGALLGLAAQAAARGRLSAVRWRWLLAFLFGGLSLLSSAMMRGHVGGFVNVLIPLYWTIGAGVAVALGRWASDRGYSRALIPLGLGLQLWLLIPTIRSEKLVPTEADRVAGDRLVQVISALDGPILAPYSPWLVHQAGKTPGVHLIAYWDVINSKTPFRRARADFKRASEAHHWGSVIYGPRPMGFGVESNYSLKTRFFDRKAGPVFFQKTGWRARPKGVALPNVRSAAEGDE